MDQNFNTVWGNTLDLNAIPSKVYDEINILIGASQSFIDEVCLLESTTDLKVRAELALAYLKENNGIELIDFKTLGQYLCAPKNVDLAIWRQLYILERSIKPRNSNWSWVNRLKMFYNTYLEEHGLLGQYYKDHKFYFLNKSGDHENLHAGMGTYGSDFYYFDDSIEGSN